MGREGDISNSNIRFFFSFLPLRFPEGKLWTGQRLREMVMGKLGRLVFPMSMDTGGSLILILNGKQLEKTGKNENRVGRNIRNQQLDR